MLLKKLLFISNNASATGAPMALLRLADVLSDNGYEINFLLKNGGPLEPKFKKIGNTFLWRRRPSNLYQKLLNRFKLFEHTTISKIPFNTYTAVVSNTITNGDILLQIRQHYGGKIISYVHELSMSTKFFTNPQYANNVIQSSDLFLVPAKVVADYLSEAFKVSPDNIFPLNHYIPFKVKDADLKKELKNEFTVCGIGSVEWHKGTDLFIETAMLIKQKYNDIQVRFLWKGGFPGHIETEKLNHDIKKAGLHHMVEIIESSENMEDFYNSIDLLYLSSREDTFPLVILEAAAFEVPTLCFANTGGAPAFVDESEGGSIVPYMDIESAAQQISFYYHNPTIMKQQGLNAKIYMSNRYQNKNVIIEQFNKAIAAVKQ